MHERLQERVDYLKNLSGIVTSRGENGQKFLYRYVARNNDFSNQGNFEWVVQHIKRNGDVHYYGPMDLRELKMTNPELFYSDEIIEYQNPLDDVNLEAFYQKLYEGTV